MPDENNITMTLNDEKILSSIEIEPTETATFSLIWLHGLGADGTDFVPIVSELNLPKTLPIRFIFPHAPVIPITVNNGYEMRAWFDVTGFTADAPIDQPGIAKSIRSVEKLIEHEVERGIPTTHIILAGFSQGAAIALSTALLYPKALAGAIALSGYLPLADELLTKASKVNRTLPIFMAHGTEDNILRYDYGKAAYLSLSQAGYSVSWHSYTMPHSVCAAEIHDISQWIRSLRALTINK